MGTTLTGKRVQNTYDSLLKLSDNDNLTGTPKIVGSGLGTDSPIYLSTTKVGIGMSPSVQFQTSGDAQIGNNLVVGGNLTVNGTTTYIDSTIVEIGDNMIELAKDNTANIKDIGWYGTINDGSEKYVGVFYDASTGTTTPEFHVGLGTAEPSSTATWTVKGKIVIGQIDSTGGTFSGQITIPETPTADGHAASKKYVDDQISGADKARRVTITVKNTETVALSAGTVVHAEPTASPPSGNIVQVKKADYDTASLMPAIGILNEDLDAAGGTNDEGEAIMFGFINGIDTSGFSAGDELYVGNDGALTNSKPLLTTQLIQKIAVVMKVDSTNGSIEVFGAGRSNDVPNRIERDVNFTDNSVLSFGTGSDLRLQHSTGNNSSYIQNYTGDLIVENLADDKDIIFKSDNGSGGTEVYFELQGVSGGANPFTVFPDNSFAVFGDSHDLQLYHNGTHSFVKNTTGNLYLLDDGYVEIGSGVELYAGFVKDGPVNLYYDNSKKFETTSSGVTVTGDGNFTGNINISSTYPRINLTDTNHNDDWSIINADGTFRVYNSTDAVDSFDIDSSNNATFAGDITVSGGDVNAQKFNNSTGNVLDTDGTHNYLKGGNAGSNILYGQYSAFRSIGHIYPHSDSTYNLGTSTLRWASVNSDSFYDGYITWSAAQINRYGAAIELQFTPTNAATLVKIGANGSNPTIFNAYNGLAQFSGHVEPNTDSTSNLGASSKRWANIYGDNLDVPIISVNDYIKIENGNSTFSVPAPPNTNVPLLYIRNSNNTASTTTAHAIVALRTQINGGDPFVSFDVENETGWTAGMDNSDNKFKITTGWNDVGGTTGLIISTTGELDSPYFASYSNINSTGDGGAFIKNGQRLGFDESGTRSWTVKAASGQLNFYSGDGLGAAYFFQPTFGVSSGSAQNLDLVLNNTAGGSTDRVRIKTTANSVAWDLENDQNLTAFKIRYTTGGSDVVVLNNGSPSSSIVTNSTGVGINTATIDEKLTVNGNIQSNDALLFKNTTSGIKWQFYRDGNQTFNLRYNNGSTWSSNAISVKTNNYVGINTTDPQFPTHITGRTLIEGSGYLLDVQATDTNNTRLQFYVDGNDTNIISGYDTTAKPMRFWTGGSERMRVTSTGNVLINTITDNTYDKLQVIGNAYIGGNATRGVRIADGGTYASMVGINQAVTAYTALELRASGTNGQLFLRTDGKVSVNTTGGYQTFYVNGDMGIPGTNKIVFNNEPTAWYIQARTTTSTSFMSTNLKNMIICGGGANEGLAIGGVNQGDASFEVKNDGRAKIKTSLSIGTNSTNQALHVAGNIYVEDGQTTGLGVILQNGDRPMITRGWDAFTSGSYTGIGRWGLFMEAATTFLASPGTDYTNGLVSLGGYTASGTPQYNLTVNNYTRRVGIGTTQPSHTLTIGSGQSNFIRIHNAASGDISSGILIERGTATGLQIYDNPADNATTFLAAGMINFRTNGSQRMRIDTSGRVGINESSPATDSILSMVSSYQYGLQIGHNQNNSSDDFEDCLFIKNINSNNSNYVSLGMSTRGTDGQHHRVQIRAYKGGGNYEGQLRFYMRQTNASNVEKYRFYANGEFHADSDIVAFSTTISDKRLKDKVVTIDSALDKVKSLRGVEYVWNSGSKKGKKDLGVIAQEVEEILPEIVTEKEMAFFGEEKYKTVDYEKLTAVLIESVKELSAKVEALENRNCNCNCK
jgi:hypothetical protein